MIGQNHNFPKVSFLLVTLLIVSMISACGRANDLQSEVQKISEPAALAGSSQLSGSLPKQAQPSNNEQLAKAAEKEAPPQSDAAIPGNAGALVQPLAVQKDSVLPLPAEELTMPAAELPALAQIQEQVEVVSSKVAVDLSLPVEPRVGARAPDFNLQTLTGQSIQLSSLAGNLLVINYWATWCIPCKQELPILEKLSKEYATRGVVFVSINALDQDSLDNVQSLVDELSMTFPVLLDQERQFADGYQAIFFPTTFLVDESGVIREISLGDNTEAELRTSLDNLLAGS